MTRLTLSVAFALLLSAAVAVPNYVPYPVRLAAARHASVPAAGVSMPMGRRLVSRQTGGTCGLYCDYDFDCRIGGGPCNTCVLDPNSKFYHQCGGGSCGLYCDYDHDCSIAGGPCRSCDFNKGSPTYHLCH